MFHLTTSICLLLMSRMPVLFSLRGVESIFRPAWPTGLTDHRHRRAKFRVDRPILGASAPKT